VLGCCRSSGGWGVRKLWKAAAAVHQNFGDGIFESFTPVHDQARDGSTEVDAAGGGSHVRARQGACHDVVAAKDGDGLRLSVFVFIANCYQEILSNDAPREPTDRRAAIRGPDLNLGDVVNRTCINADRNRLAICCGLCIC